MKKYNNFLLNDFLLIFAVLFLLFSIEIFLRLLPNEILGNLFTIFKNRNMYQNDSELGYKLKPNLKTFYGGHLLITNSKGLRDREFYFDKKPDLRILALGDSFTFGEGVEAEGTYPKMMEWILQKKYPKENIAVVNCGVSGYGNDQELNFLKREGVYYKPDLVILGLYMGNDFLDNEIGGVKRKRVKENGFLYDVYIEKDIHDSLKDKKLEILLFDFDRYLKRKSLAYFLIKKKFDYLLWKLGLNENYDGYKMLDKENFHYFRKDLTERDMRGFDLTFNLIKGINRNAEKLGSKFLVILIPAGFQIYEDVFDGLIKACNLNKKDYSMERLDFLLQERLVKEGMPVLNLLPILKENKEKELYAFGHWTPITHRIAAEEIDKFIENTKLIF